MPRTLKRRSDAISRDASPSVSASPEPPRRRQRSSDDSPTPSQSAVSSAAEDDENTQAETQKKTLIKKLVRLALATEYSRIPLRRSDISTKIFKDTNSSRQFKNIFAEAQKVLQNTFGMRLVELPSKEKTSLKDRRTQATQTRASNTSSKSWILVSTLPDHYKRNPNLVQPSHADSDEIESGYTALYSFIIALIYLNNGELAEGKLERYLKRVNADSQTAFGSYEKVTQRMIREGYIEKKKDTLNGEDVISFIVGPRGKMEGGAKGLEGLVKKMCLKDAAEENEAAQMDEAELNKRLTRSLGISIGGQQQAVLEEAEEEASTDPPQDQRRSTRRRVGGDDDDYH